MLDFLSFNIILFSVFNFCFAFFSSFEASLCPDLSRFVVATFLSINGR